MFGLGTMELLLVGAVAALMGGRLALVRAARMARAGRRLTQRLRG